MSIINKSNIKDIALSYNVIPIIKEITGDMETPISIFSVFSDEPFSFFFESAEGVGKWGRYSFICLNPHFTVSLLDKNIVFNKFEEKNNISSGISSCNYSLDEIDNKDIFSFLKEIISQYKIYNKDLPENFTAGLFGYLGYEICSLIEKLPPTKKDVTDVPDLFLMLPKNIIIYDSLLQKILIVVLLINDDFSENIEEKFDDAINNITNIVGKIRDRNCGNHVEKIFDANLKSKNIEIIDEVDFNLYKEKVLKAKDYILKGDIFQIQISRRKKILNFPNPFCFYRALRLVNPSPYMFYLKINDFIIAGSSPENLIKLSDNIIETRPIAGTIVRGSNPAEDEMLALKLLDDPKERAEHVMLVDLGRNDIGRVSKIGTVKVDKLMYIEKYSHVQHIVTNIVAEIDEKFDAFDLIRATFPAGTLTGAPKVRAMELINEMEDSKRGVYGGGVGYFGFLNNGKCEKMEFCITIRTALFNKSACYVQAAGGIVFDSTPENEFAETENKLKHLITAFDIAGKLCADSQSVG
jgi:anthranilate synthase component 1